MAIKNPKLKVIEVPATEGARVLETKFNEWVAGGHYDIEDVRHYESTEKISQGLIIIYTGEEKHEKTKHAAEHRPWPAHDEGQAQTEAQAQAQAVANKTDPVAHRPEPAHRTETPAHRTEPVVHKK